MPTLKKTGISRRDLIRAGTIGLLSLSGMSSRVWSSADGNYAGKCLVTLQFDGGADVTQLCDPKINTPGEPKINNWADRADPGQAGNIMYAPVADNEWLLTASVRICWWSTAWMLRPTLTRPVGYSGGRAVTPGASLRCQRCAAFNSPDQPLAYVVFRVPIEHLG